MFSPRTRSLVCHTSDWGQIRLVIPVAFDGNPWGDLACLRGTWAESLLAICSAEEYEMACRGYGTPLKRVLGPEPRHRLQQLKARGLVCLLRSDCVMHKPKICHPHPKMPECFVPSVAQDSTDPRFAWALARVLLSLAADFYVLVPLD